MAPLRCPMCDLRLEEGATHCPECGLRVAPLPRRPPRPGSPSRRRSPLPDPGDPHRQALVRGIVIGAALDAAATAAGALARLGGYSARDVAGNVLVVVCVALLVAGTAVGGVRVRRWAPPEQLRSRVAASGRGDARRTALLAAAGVTAAGFLIAAALP